MSTEKSSDDVEKMSFEEALKELELIVRQLESGQGELDASISAYERGARIKAHCEMKLKDAQTRIDKIVSGPDGSIKTVSVALDD